MIMSIWYALLEFCVESRNFNLNFIGKSCIKKFTTYKEGENVLQIYENWPLSKS